MITRLRRLVSKQLEVIAKVLQAVGMTPNAVTLLGLAIAGLCPILAYAQNPVGVFAAFAMSSIMDALDGALARVSGRITKFGSILDSFSDRVEEGLYFASLVILGLPPVWVIFSLMVSFAISYLRALGEKHSIKLEGVGLLERGERLLILAVVFAGVCMDNMILSKTSIVLLLLLGSVTVVQRLLYIYQNITSSEAL
uniref:CDP-alcohol phosphatidyltransferase family protein n=1 Tax=Ignisphaera aggregans TaxID=334771 RepID=A0A7C2ZC63_9CREN